MGDFAVGGVDGDGHLLTVLLVTDHLLDVDTPSSSVDSEDFAGLASHSSISASALNEDGVSLPNGNGSAVVLGSKFLAEVAAHHLSSNTTRGAEVGLSALSSLAGNAYTQLKLSIRSVQYLLV